MKQHLWLLFLAVTLDDAVRRGDATCVLESDFGFNLKCRFKKSGLFRVRNLGGVKGYFGLGFAVGDELGLPESLSNSEASKRRSTAAGRSSLLYNPLTKKNEPTRLVSLTTGYRLPPPAPALPAFKPLPPAARAPQQPQSLSRPSRLAVPGGGYVPSITAVVAPALGVPSFHALPASVTRGQAAAASTPPPAQLVAVQVVRAPTAFRQSLQAASSHFQVRQDTVKPAAPPATSLTTRRLPAAEGNRTVSSAAMRQTIKLLAQASNLSEETVAAAIMARQQQLLMQQQQAMALASTTTTTTTTASPPPEVNVIHKYPLAGASKVMNAPKEYYPVGYDKNFDDNFASRVELPDTSFYCGDQKHFPGLYADEDLGCMVFHVCAFTDDGLIMKSFLCPESTLFDQTILKCNWWFYVDCKASKKLYDSNIPVSKSYQLMKALAFFSSYNKS